MTEGVTAADRAIEIVIDGGVGDVMQVTRGEDGALFFEIEEPWAGDTETGFGARTSATLNKDQANALIAWLNKQ